MRLIQLNLICYNYKNCITFINRLKLVQNLNLSVSACWAWMCVWVNGVGFQLLRMAVLLSSCWRVQNNWYLDVGDVLLEILLYCFVVATYSCMLFEYCSLAWGQLQSFIFLSARSVLWSGYALIWFICLWDTSGFLMQFYWYSSY